MIPATITWVPVVWLLLLLELSVARANNDLATEEALAAAELDDEVAVDADDEAPPPPPDEAMAPPAL